MSPIVPPRTAGSAAIVSIASFVVSLVALALFFGGAGAIFGPINDIAISLSLLLVVPAILVTGALAGGTTGPWFQWIGYLAILGIALAAGGQFLLVAGLVPLETTFVTFSLGALPYLLWVTSTAFVARRGTVLPRTIARWAWTFLGLTIAGVVLASVLPLSPALLTLLVGVPVTIGYVGWLLAVARWLGSAA